MARHRRSDPAPGERGHHRTPAARPARHAAAARRRVGLDRAGRVAAAVVLGAGVVAAGTGAVTASGPAVTAGGSTSSLVDATGPATPDLPADAAADLREERARAAGQRADVRAAERAAAERAAAERAAAEEAGRRADEEAAARAAELAQAEREQEEAASRSAERDPRSVAAAMVADRGWSSEQMSCLDSLWTKESSWEWDADNPTSSAYGIPQALPGEKMASAGADWETNPVTQIRWGLGYIEASYGTPCEAWGHSQANDWY